MTMKKRNGFLFISNELGFDLKKGMVFLLFQMSYDFWHSHLPVRRKKRMPFYASVTPKRRTLHLLFIAFFLGRGFFMAPRLENTFKNTDTYIYIYIYIYAPFLNILSTNRVQSASQHGLLSPERRYL